MGASGLPAPDLTALYRAEFPYVWHSLRRLGIPSRDLEDLAHDVFVVVQQRLGDFDASRPVKPWLFGIAFRVASRFLRRAGHRREVLDDPPDAPGAERPADQALEDEEARRLVLRALGMLDVDKRAVLVMHDLDGHPMPEIASALSIPLNTAYSRLRLAREDFTRAVLEVRSKRGLRWERDR